MLGLPTTAEIGRIISILAGIDPSGTLSYNATLSQRIEKAFEKWPIPPKIHESFKDLLLVLNDGDGAKDSDKEMGEHIKHVHRVSEAYADQLNIPKDKRLEVEACFNHLHHIYDWIGVRSVAKYIARKWQENDATRGEIEYQDLLTTVDQLIESNLGMPTEELFCDYDKRHLSERVYLIDKPRLLGIQRCLSHLTSTIQRMVIQSRPGKLSKKKLAPYWAFAKVLADLMKEESQAFYRRGYDPDERCFYYYSYSFISYNWDPIMARLIFQAHKRLNDEKINIGGSVLRLFNDSGEGIGIRKIKDKEDSGTEGLLTFMMNESTCKRVNDRKYRGGAKSRLLRVGKMLFPHAGLGWRICPRCGKLFTDFGENLEDLYSTVAFGPDLLPDINVAWDHRTSMEEEHEKYGDFGVVQCIFCGSLTRPYDSPLILQSGIKSERHYVMEGIFRELGLVVGNAKHIIFAGYSLPKDDYVYRCFFQSSWAGKIAKGRRESRFCSLINYDPGYARSVGYIPWLEGNEIKKYLRSKKGETSTKETVRNLLGLFDKSDIRLSLLGFPGVVTKRSDKDLREATIDLLYPKRCFPEGFPIKRK